MKRKWVSFDLKSFQFLDFNNRLTRDWPGYLWQIVRAFPDCSVRPSRRGRCSGHSGPGNISRYFCTRQTSARTYSGPARARVFSTHSRGRGKVQGVAQPLNAIKAPIRGTSCLLLCLYGIRASYPLCHKKGARNDPLGLWMTDMDLHGIAAHWRSWSRWTSTNESGEHCAGVTQSLKMTGNSMWSSCFSTSLVKVSEGKTWL